MAIKSMSDILLTILILALSSAVYFLWVKPVRAMKAYIKFVKAQGYTVYEMPYKPWKNYMLEVILEGLSEGDAMKFYKEIGSQYDVVVSNSFFSPYIEFNHPDFVKDYYSVDKHYQYPKLKGVVDVFSRLIGHSLPFSEGENWKRKRNILNKVFNFDFVKSQTYKISEVCSAAIRELQAGAKKNEQENTVTYNVLDLTVRMFSQVIMESFLGATKNEIIMSQPAGKFLKKLVGDICQQNFNPINFILGSKFLSLGITPDQREIQNRV